MMPSNQGCHVNYPSSCFPWRIEADLASCLVEFKGSFAVDVLSKAQLMDNWMCDKST